MSREKCKQKDCELVSPEELSPEELSCNEESAEEVSNEGSSEEVETTEESDEELKGKSLTSEGLSNYERGKIYKLKSNKDKEFYIGATTRELENVLQELKRHANTVKGKLYEHMKKIGIESYAIELLEVYSCKTNKELIKRKGVKVRELKPCLNEKIYETEEEKHEKRKKKRKERHKKELEKENNYMKEYRKKNQPKKRATQNAKRECEVCGRNYTSAHKQRHEKSKKHKNATKNVIQ